MEKDFFFQMQSLEYILIKYQRYQIWKTRAHLAAIHARLWIGYTWKKWDMGYIFFLKRENLT